MARLNQLGQVLIEGMERHTAHGDGLAQMLPPLGQRDAKGFGGNFCILKKNS